MSDNTGKVKVTVIIPCYNMELKISRMLNSLMTQTSREFKVYVIDDGSKDKSKAVIEDYVERFARLGISLNYIHQDNAGVSAAVNNGLKRVDTDFFCLPDADDYLEATYMEECIGFLMSHQDCGIVFTQCNVFHQNQLGKRIGLLQRKDAFEKPKIDICKDFIWGNGVYYCPNYMIRTKDFKIANGDLQIEAGRYGQNYQILLPITFSTRSGYIAKPLYNYIIYNQSISHGKRTIEQRYMSFDGGTKSLHETIKKMKLDEDIECEFHYQIEQKNAIQKAEVACEYGDKKLFEEFYGQIDREYLSSKLKRIYNRRKWPLLFKFESFKIRSRKMLSGSDLTYKIKSFLSK